MKTLFNLIKINLKVYFRQPDAIFWAICFPVILSWVLGIAFSKKGLISPHIGLLLPQQQIEILTNNLRDQEPILGKKLDKKILINLHHYQSKAQAIQALKQGEIAIILTKGKPYEYQFDPRNNQAQIAYLLIKELLHKNSVAIKDIKILTTQGTRYIDFLIPGLIAFNMLSASLWGLGWVFIEMRIKKHLKRLMATPISRISFLGAQVLTRMIFSMVEICFIFGFAMLMFGIQLQGSWLAFLYLFFAGSFAFSGIAILIGSRTASTMTGNGLVNIVMMPMVLTSGIFFSYQNFPAWLVPIIRWFPLSIFADLMRGVCNQGFMMADVLLPSTPLIILGLVCYLIGLKIFKWY